MKKIVFVLVFVLITLCSFSEEQLPYQVFRDAGLSLRMMFAGQTMVVESVIPMFAAVALNYAAYKSDFIVPSSYKTVMMFSVPFVFPLIVGSLIYLRGRMLYARCIDEIPKLNKYDIYKFRLKPLAAACVISGGLAGINMLMFIPSVITATVWGNLEVFHKLIPMIVASGINMALSLPVLLSSVLMIVWIYDKHLSMSPIFGFSFDKTKVVPEEFMMGYTFKLGLTIKF